MNPVEQEQLYLEFLSTHYPSIQSVSAEILDLSSELQLPKRPEHYISDIHGEYEMFHHVLRTGSGAIQYAIDTIFSASLTEKQKADLAFLIYYPEEKIQHTFRFNDDKRSWYLVTLPRLIKVARYFLSQCPRKKVKQIVENNFAATLEELLYESASEDKAEYYSSILNSVIDTYSAPQFIVSLSTLIRSLTVGKLHIIGDIYDRGPGAQQVMDALIEYQSVDIQWGNHDIIWMGAAAGSEACMANVVRICLRYGNLETLESGYAISLLPLASLAVEVYGDDDCRLFTPKASKGEEHSAQSLKLMAQMHKAMTIIQFKLEGQVINRRPQYQMSDRLLLDKIDHENKTVEIDGKKYSLLDGRFPTVDPADPYLLTEGEEAVVEKLIASFVNSAKLQKHTRFLYSNGSMYLVNNDNLLFHGCIAMNKDGSFKDFNVAGESYSGKEFMDRAEALVRNAYFSRNAQEKSYGLDAIWYMWNGAQSPLFGKEKMATFERYFLAEKEPQAEGRNPYYDLRNNEEAVKKILIEFDIDPEKGRIVNGHVPVKVIKGESPVKAGGKLLVIDGGFSNAYRQKTGIAGYTLVYNTDGIYLVVHQPFESVQETITRDTESGTKTECVEASEAKILVRDTDEGRLIQSKIDRLKLLLEAYHNGEIKESLDANISPFDYSP